MNTAGRNSQQQALQQRLIWCLYDLHRPEIADWIAACQITLSGHTLLVRYSDNEPLGVTVLPLRQWLEQLLEQVAWQFGLPVEQVQII